MLFLEALKISATQPRWKGGYLAPSFYLGATVQHTSRGSHAPMPQGAPTMANAWNPDIVLNNISPHAEKAIYFSIHSV